MNDTLIARLAAANPVPLDTPASGRAASATGRRPRVLAIAAAVAIAVPALALGGVIGFSNQGTPVATGDLPLTQDTDLQRALQQLDFPSTLRFLGSREGISFYAARRADGDFCFAVDSAAEGRGVGCVVGGPPFPSPQRPIIDYSGGGRLAGFAADAVATVAALDGSGAVVSSAPVVDNLYAAPMAASAVAIEARAADGAVLFERELP